MVIQSTSQEINSRAGKDVWQVFAEREKGLISDCANYASNDPSGLPGHNLLLIIAKFETLVQCLVEQMEPEAVQRAIEAARGEL